MARYKFNWIMNAALWILLFANKAPKLLFKAPRKFAANNSEGTLTPIEM